MARDPIGKLLWFVSEFFLENASVSFVKCHNTIGHSYYLCKSWQQTRDTNLPVLVCCKHSGRSFSFSQRHILHFLGHKMLIRPKKLLFTSHLVSSLHQAIHCCR